MSMGPKFGGLALVRFPLNAASSSADVVVALRNSAYPYLRQGLVTGAAGAVVGTPLAFTANFFSVSNNLVGENSLSAPLVGCTIPTGSVWTAEIYEAVNHGDDVPEASISNWTIEITNDGPANANAISTNPAQLLLRIWEILI